MNSLPNEILLQILGNLPYWDLKFRLPLVNKKFHALVLESSSKYGQIDRALFRDSIPPPLPPATDSAVNIYRVHPAFGLLSFELSVKCICDIGLTTSHYWKKHNKSLGGCFCCQKSGPHQGMLVDHPVSSENATSPAVAEVAIHVGDFAPINLKAIESEKGRGVRVIDVISTIVNSLGGEMNGDDAKGVWGCKRTPSSIIYRGFFGEKRAKLLEWGYPEKGPIAWKGIQKVKVARAKDSRGEIPQLYVFQY